jgi:L-serine kinase (ADP)
VTNRPQFRLLDARRLREHEQVEDEVVRHVIRQIRSEGLVREPIWVAKGTGVILNGHHRYRALVAMGARRVPAWVIDYSAEYVDVKRWGDGAAPSKEEIVLRAREGRPFPPKTSRHTLRVELPPRPTPLSLLLTDSARSRRRRTTATQLTAPRLPRGARSSES